MNFLSWFLAIDYPEKDLEMIKKIETFGRTSRGVPQKMCKLIFLLCTFEQGKSNPVVSFKTLTFGEQGIFHKKGNLGEPIASLDSWHDFLSKSPYLCHRCPSPVHLEFFSPAR